MFNIIRVMLVPPAVMVLVLTSWCIVNAPDLMAAALGADPDWLWPVVLLGVWEVIRLLPDLDPPHVDEPWEVMRCFTPKELYGDDHAVGTCCGGGNLHVGKRPVGRHVRGSGLTASTAIR